MRSLLSDKIIFVVALLTIHLVFDLFEPLVLGQRQGVRRKPTRKQPKNRGRNRGQKSEDVGIYCYTCFADFERVPLTVFNPVNYIYNNPCYNPALNYTLTDNEYLTKCSSTTKYCMVDVTRLNGVLISVDRRCGQSTCRKTCLSRGYGVIRETCTFCCGGRINEDHPDYDEEVNSVYKCPNEPH